MWTYSNPVKTHFGAGNLDMIGKLIGGRRYALVTYPDLVFEKLRDRVISLAGPAVLEINDVAPNPDYALLGDQCARFAPVRGTVELIVALGGGSVVDSAKVFAAGAGGFEPVRNYLETGSGVEKLTEIPIIAIATTAGTASEMTSWATVWDETGGRKFSLNRPNLYPEAAIIDPELTLGKPHMLTLSTGLDALSHALESIWNVNANPVSATFAVDAARTILKTLPALLGDLKNYELRENMSRASLFSGYAFSNTKTAIAHNLSYPITLEYGTQHGIACSFTLPVVLASVRDISGFRGDALRRIFGDDLALGVKNFRDFLTAMKVPATVAELDIDAERWVGIVDAAFAGERGKNFVGQKSAFNRAASEMNFA